MSATAALPAIEERAIDGNYGEIFYNGHYQGDMKDITGTVAIAQQVIPRAGSTGQVYRRGRVTRSGGVTILKIDSRFENKLFEMADLTPDRARELRGKGINPFPDAELLIKIDDPGSWGAEEILLFGVKFWEIGVGFTENTLVERQLPITWNSESLVHAIPRPNNLSATWTSGVSAALPPGAITTYPAAGRDPDPVI